MCAVNFDQTDVQQYIQNFSRVGEMKQSERDVRQK